MTSHSTNTKEQDSSLDVMPIFHRVPDNGSLPTYFKVNKFTQGFQSIIDAYGVAVHGEINPGQFK